MAGSKNILISEKLHIKKYKSKTAFNISIRKSKETQVVEMKILVKIILIVSIYSILVKNKYLINKKSTNHKETNNKTHKANFGLYRNVVLTFD
jgi:hypothetical protein